MNYADLHVHTNYSDGTFSPEEAVNKAKSLGLNAISITDHDITDGINEAVRQGESIGLEVIPGIELSAEMPDNSSIEIHILGYFIDYLNEELQNKLKSFRKTRTERAFKIYEKLAGLNIHLDKNIFIKLAEHSSVGRLHFAKEMIKEGYVRNTSEAFSKYLGTGKSAYVPKARLTPEEAIKLILDAGGVPVLAHPSVGGFNNVTLLTELIGYGLKGMEVWHSKHTQSLTQELNDMCNRLGLVPTGGSDCHGIVIDGSLLMGRVKIPYDIVERIKIKGIKSETI